MLSRFEQIAQDRGYYGTPTLTLNQAARARMAMQIPSNDANQAMRLAQLAVVGNRRMARQGQRVATVLGAVLVEASQFMEGEEDSSDHSGA